MIEVKRIRIVILSIVLLGALSCSSQYGPTENEAYAGAWMGLSELGIEEISEMMDTTFETYVHYQGLNGFVPGYKGFLANDAANSTISVITTHIYVLDNYTTDINSGQILAQSASGYYSNADEANSEFAAFNYRETYSYTISGDTMVFDGSFVMTRTNPVSDSLLK